MVIHTFLTVVNVVKVRLLSKRNVGEKIILRGRGGKRINGYKNRIFSAIRGNSQTTSRAFSRLLTPRFLDRVDSSQRERARGVYLRLYFDSFRWGTLVTLG